MTLAKRKARRKIDEFRVRGKRWGDKSVNVTKLNLCPYYCSIHLPRCAVAWPTFSHWIEICFWMHKTHSSVYSKWSTHESWSWDCTCLFSRLVKLLDHLCPGGDMHTKNTDMHTNLFINLQIGKYEPLLLLSWIRSVALTWFKAFSPSEWRIWLLIGWTWKSKVTTNIIVVILTTYRNTNYPEYCCVFRQKKCKQTTSSLETAWYYFCCVLHMNGSILAWLSSMKC